LKKLHHWIQDEWNIMDMIGFIVLAIGFTLKLSTDPGNDACTLISEGLEECCPLQLSPKFQTSQILYTFSFIVLMIRMMHFYIVTNVMGPKIIIIWHMLKDMVFFLMIFGILIYAYGASIQGLLYPNEFRISEVFDGIFRRPILTIFGETFMKEVQAWGFEGLPDPGNSPTDSDPGAYCTNATTKSGLLQNLADYATLSMRCPQQNWFIKGLSLFYMMTANIILLNLLIAMFTHSFDAVKSNQSGDMDLWNSKRYALILEFHRRPALVPPFNVFSLVAKMIEYLLDCSSLRDRTTETASEIHRKRDETKRPMMRQFFSETYYEKLDPNGTKIDDTTIEELDAHFHTVSESYISKYRKKVQEKTVEEKLYNPGDDEEEIRQKPDQMDEKIMLKVISDRLLKVEKKIDKNWRNKTKLEKQRKIDRRSPDYVPEKPFPLADVMQVIERNRR
jgi:hypothetical protein